MFKSQEFLNQSLNIAKIIMKEEGYGSLDETISNVIKWYFAKLKGKKT